MAYSQPNHDYKVKQQKAYSQPNYDYKAKQQIAYTSTDRANMLINNPVAYNISEYANAIGLDYNTVKRLFELYNGEESAQAYQDALEYHNQDKNDLGLSNADRFVELETTDENSGTIRVMLDIVFVNFNLKKHLVQTKIPGANGTIKQELGNRDFEFTFTGSLVGINAYNPPYKQVKDLQNLVRVNKKVDVFSNYINDALNITILVITNLKIKKDKKLSNVYNFEIKALSDVIGEKI